MLLITYSFIAELLFLGLIKNLIRNWEITAIIFMRIHIFLAIAGIMLISKKQINIKLRIADKILSYNACIRNQY